MQEGDVPSVEFLDADPAPGADEELGYGETAPALRRLLIGGLLVAVLAGAMLTRIAASDDRDRAAAPSTAEASATRAPVAAVIGPTAVRQEAVAGCPAQAQCSTWEWVPPETVAAVQAAFPHATIQGRITQIANRYRRFEPDLLSRLLTARAGWARITLTVLWQRHPSATEGIEVHALRGEVRVVAHRAGYEVTVFVGGTSNRAVRRGAVALAEDDRVLMPQ